MRRRWWWWCGGGGGGGVGVPRKSRSLLFLPSLLPACRPRWPRRARGAEGKEGWGRTREGEGGCGSLCSALVGAGAAAGEANAIWFFNSPFPLRWWWGISSRPDEGFPEDDPPAAAAARAGSRRWGNGGGGPREARRGEARVGLLRGFAIWKLYGLDFAILHTWKAIKERECVSAVKVTILNCKFMVILDSRCRGRAWMHKEFTRN